MNLKKLFFKEIEDITKKLIETNFAKEFNFPTLTKTTLKWSNFKDFSFTLKNTINYNEIYSKLEETKNFNIKMIDGGIFQLLYEFEFDKLIKHRLAFFPTNFILDYDNFYNYYEKDSYEYEIYKDMIGDNMVRFPIRFDYAPEQCIDMEHPKSHLHLGQYENCRIPIVSPLSPNIFFRFILMNFYNRIYKSSFCENDFKTELKNLDKTLTSNEKNIIHLHIV